MAVCMDCPAEVLPRSSIRGPALRCPPCKAAHLVARHQDRRLQRKFGITNVDYAALLAEQGGRCAICRTDRPGGRGRFHVDHDHATGKVRGLLCAKCNRALGYLGDDPAHVLAAHQYLVSRA